ncbi:sensor histidine kinase [Flavilitoribacter nigricans]|nr:histidine kinase [Flavilitoribacter nigricans]
MERHHLLWQLLLWTFAWLVISFFLTDGMENFSRFVNIATASAIGIPLIVTINLGVLLPRLYFRKKYLFFILAAVAILIGITYLIHGDIWPWSDWLRNPTEEDRPRIERPDRRNSFNGFRWMALMMPFLIAFLGSTLIEIARFANRQEKQAIRSDKEKLETELKFLKSQVNPHFLFNALNNIYSLSVVESPQTPESIMQLSEILRYMVYDADADRVPLKNEILYIQNYVSLKQLKDSRGMDIRLDLESPAGDLMIAPLLFIPFVENAFKHSKIEDLNSGYIHISLRTEGRTVDFRVENSLPANEFTKDRVGGVGLENTAKRLALLYPGDRHQLEIEKGRDRFSVHLSLAL